jgi:hypothetical protein
MKICGWKNRYLTEIISVILLLVVANSRAVVSAVMNFRVLAPRTN